MRYRYQNTVYNIKVKNLKGKNTGVERFILDGENIESKQIKLEENGGTKEIEIII